MFSEPSKAEQIIEDAKAALWNELTEEVKQLMDDANEAKTKADEIRREVSSLNWEKAQLEEEIKQLRDKKVYVEAHEVPARQVKAIVNHLMIAASVWSASKPRVRQIRSPSRQVMTV